MKPVLLIVIRTEPVAAWDSVGVLVNIADTARTANPDFIAQKEPSIVVTDPTLFVQPAADRATGNFRNASYS